MTDNYPITLPPELFAEWFANSLKTLDRKVSRDDTGTTGLIAGEVAIQAARWGADQELEACLAEVSFFGSRVLADKIRNTRRPKPPSLKEQALTALHAVATGANDTREQHQDFDTIRKALEALPND